MVSYVYSYLLLLLFACSVYYRVRYDRYRRRMGRLKRMHVRFFRYSQVLCREYGAYDSLTRVTVVASLLGVFLVALSVSLWIVSLVDTMAHGMVSNFIRINAVNMVAVALVLVILHYRKAHYHLTVMKEVSFILNIIYIYASTGRNMDYMLKHICALFAKSRFVLAQDFYWLLNEITLGASRDQAWEGLRDRLGCDEVSFFVTLLKKSQVFDAQLIANIRDQREIMIQQYLLGVESFANKSVIYSALLLTLFMFPAFLLMLMGPAVLNFSMSSFFFS
jgi:tight adherence protein C